MKLVRAGSKNSPIYYIQRSVRINGKSTTKSVERLGSLSEIKARCGHEDPLVWARRYTAELTQREKEAKQDILLKYSASTLIDPFSRNACSVGYLFLKDIYYRLELDKICKTISQKYKFEFDLNEILSMLVFSRVLYPGSKRSSLKDAQHFLESPACDLHQVYRGLEILAKENHTIQAKLYENSKTVIERNPHILYYDCTNYYFEIEADDDFRKFGMSKEHRPNPIVQMGLFIDGNGIPLAFSMFEGNKNEQGSLKPLEKQIIRDYNTGDLVICTDAGLSSTANRKFNNINGRKFITTQSLKKLKGFLQEFALADDGWSKPGSRKTYQLSEIDMEAEFDTVFYKSRWIHEDQLEQKLIVSYSPKYANYQRNIRENQVERAKRFLKHPSAYGRKGQNDPKRFLTSLHHTEEGVMAEKRSLHLNETKIQDEAVYDGFYAVCTNWDIPEEKIIRINKKRWQIEECFRIMKSEFKARPVYLSKRERITAHFASCFIALVLYRILESKLGGQFSCDAIVSTLRDMDMLIVPGEGFIPSYTRTEITDTLHQTFGFRTDYQITSQKNMRKILNQVKRRGK